VDWNNLAQTIQELQAFLSIVIKILITSAVNLCNFWFLPDRKVNIRLIHSWYRIPGAGMSHYATSSQHANKF
jgi:hypothetical protein